MNWINLIIQFINDEISKKIIVYDFGRVELSRNICIWRQITEAAAMALGGIAEICCFSSD